MRIEPGTYIAAAARSSAVLLVLLAGCSGGGSKEAKAPEGALTVYISVPAHGVEARAGQATAVGAQLALSDAHGRAGEREVKLVRLDDSKPEGPTWDPSMVEANAKRAAADPAAIAYIGELDEGGSAISIPVTNDAGMLQVSPLDGLTTLTRNQPGAAFGTGPARYYPNGKRTFLRLVPTDALQAEELIKWAGEQGVRRPVVIQDDQVFSRALAQQAVIMAERAGMVVTGLLEPRDDPAGFEEFALRVAQDRPDAVIYTGLGDATAGPLLAAVKRRLPGVRVFGSSALASASPRPSLPDVDLLTPLRPASEYGPRARRALARLKARRVGVPRTEALYGYEAMRVVLDAINAAGAAAGDRAAVARAGLTSRSRGSVIGNYTVLPTGDVSPTSFAAYRQSGARLRYLGTRRLPPVGPRG
jgi:branched-chain amino acid transport system substrate-binding protein